MADSAEQQQYPNLNPYSGANGQSQGANGSTGQQLGQQAQSAGNTVYASKVSAHTEQCR